MSPPAELRASRKCAVGVLLPWRDDGGDGASITSKAWASSDPGYGFTLRIDNGKLGDGRTIGASQK